MLLKKQIDPIERKDLESGFLVCLMGFLTGPLCFYLVINLTISLAMSKVKSRGKDMIVGFIR